MKKISMLLMLLLAMTMQSYRVFAQSVTVTLMPGWTWISCPTMDTLDYATALGSFTPAVGDIIESQFDYSEYIDNGWWGGSQQFYPGCGYLYYSSRTTPVLLTFNVQQPTSQVMVTTTEPADITTTSAVVGGIVTISEDNHVFARGVCWDTEVMPTIDDNHISNGAETGDFSDTLTELTPGTTYYVRAYVVTDYGLAYGEELSFATPPVGAIDGLFSVSASQQVYFSQGNLQYIGSASTPYWKFADNQWDYLGTLTGQDSDSENIDRDLFGWGTSGYNHGANCYQPWSTSTSNSDYNAYGDWLNNLFDQTGQADWGYNPISNGGNQPNQWRSLTKSEWDYVFNTRTTTSGIRFVMAKVIGVNGIILLPDDWDSSSFTLMNINTYNTSFSSNIIDASQWSTLEQYGAVFLPTAGCRCGTSVNHIGTSGFYWTALRDNMSYAYNIGFYSNYFSASWVFERSYGLSVRLVQDAE